MVKVKTSEMHSVHNTGRRLKKEPSPATDRDQTPRTLVAQAVVEVKFGIASRNCDNYGVCHIDLAEHLLERKSKETHCCLRKTKAILSVSSNGSIELTFPKSAMHAETENLFFSKIMFSVEEDFELPKELAKQFDLEIKAKIIHGNYRIIETMGFYVVNFSNDFK
ncbi:MAG: hypothetical protein HUU01_04575 [Saprospiraceae bacterium]|nr:hypothetical protein [Saprospiraceae bacterium]